MSDNVIQLDRQVRANTGQMTLKDVANRAEKKSRLQTDADGRIVPGAGMVLTGWDRQGIQHWGEATGAIGMDGGAVIVVKRMSISAEVYREISDWRVCR